MKLPKNYEELRSFALRFTNRNCVQPCKDCMRKDAEEGRILGSEKLGWNPDKDELLKEINESENTVEVDDS